MRSKRLLAMLLALCLLISVVSPAVYATTAPEDAYVGTEQTEESAAKNRNFRP